MIAILHDAPFWVFMTTLIGSIRWLARVFYLYRKSLLVKKAQLDSQVENMKEDIAIRLTLQLKEVADKVNATLDRHESMIQKLDINVSNMAVVYSNMTDMMVDLRKNYQVFDQRMNSVNQGAGLVMDRIKSMETEIINLKDGLILVRTKK